MTFLRNAAMALTLASQILAQNRPLTCESHAAAPAIRTEGVAEPVGDIVVVCNGGTPVAADRPLPQVNIQVFAQLSINITSRVTAQGGNLIEFSEALLFINEPSPADGCLSRGPSFARDRVRGKRLGAGERASTAAGSTTPIPRFLDPPRGEPMLTILVCRTNILFLFVSNRSGFDTGIAIVNSSKDPFGGPSRIGSCMIGSGEHFVWSLSSGGTVPATPGFQGYACDFHTPTDSPGSPKRPRGVSRWAISAWCSTNQCPRGQAALSNPSADNPARAGSGWIRHSRGAAQHGGAGGCVDSVGVPAPAAWASGCTLPAGCTCNASFAYLSPGNPPC